MNPLRTLRGRLAAAMALILLLGVAASVLLDRLPSARGLAQHFPMLGLLDVEPYQDALVLACFSLPALILIWAVSSWSLRPLAQVSRQAQAVGPADPAARLSRTGLPAEITPLVDAVNGALDRMADAFAAERRFTENAAHELRTPLAVLGLRLQRAQQADHGGASGLDWPAIERDLAQMNRLVAQLLDLARKENAGRDGAGLQSMNLSRVGREAAAMLLPLIEAHGRTLTIDVPEALPLLGAADDVRDALCNLLENAALHGKGAITLRAAAIGAGAEIIVTDEGAGVPPGLERAVFERFRKDSASHGSGLGLAIVREVARRHGGQVEFMQGAPCRVRMVLAGGVE